MIDETIDKIVQEEIQKEVERNADKYRDRLLNWETKNIIDFINTGESQGFGCRSWNCPDRSSEYVLIPKYSDPTDKFKARLAERILEPKPLGELKKSESFEESGIKLIRNIHSCYYSTNNPAILVMKTKEKNTYEYPKGTSFAPCETLSDNYTLLYGEQVDKIKKKIEAESKNQ